MTKYSIWALARNALTRHERWNQAWRHPDPKPTYNVVAVGAGGHGLATAYYPAKEHGVASVAVAALTPAVRAAHRAGNRSAGARCRSRR